MRTFARKKRIGCPQGLAISSILLAIVLLAAVAITIAVSARSNGSHADDEKNRTLAAALIQQGNTIKTGYDYWMLTKGMDPCYIEFWDYSVVAGNAVGYWYGLYDPAYTNILHQYPPPDAFASPGNTWMRKYDCGGLINEPGFTGGHPIIAPDVTLGVCKSLNLLLNNSTAIPTSTEDLATWEDHHVTAWVNPSNANQPAACVQTSDGHYVYYFYISDS